MARPCLLLGARGPGVGAFVSSLVLAVGMALCSLESASMVTATPRCNYWGDVLKVLALKCAVECCSLYDHASAAVMVGGGIESYQRLEMWPRTFPGVP